MCVDAAEYNDILMKSYLAEVRADAGLYSTPLALVHLLVQWRELKCATDFQRSQWLQKNNIVRARIHMMDTIAFHLVRSVASIIKINGRKLKGTSVSVASSEIEDLLRDLSIGDAPDGVGDYFDEGALESSLGSSPLAEIKLFSSSGFDYTRINLCRLVIAWVGCNNVLRLKPVKGKLNPAAANSLTITDKDLTEQHLSSIFPPSIPFNLQKRDRMVFESTLCYDSNRSYLDILRSMCLVAYKCAGAKVSYRIHQDMNSEPVDLDTLAAVWVLFPTVDEAGKQQNAVVLALSDSMVDNYGNLFTGVLGNLVVDEERFCGLNLFAASDVRSKARKLLTALQNDLPGGSMFLTAPASLQEVARLSVAYVPLTEVDAEYIFQGQIYGLGLDRMKPAPKIRFNMLHCNRWVQFEEEAIKAKFSFPNSIISDISLGVRLFNAYKMGRLRDRYVLMFVPKKYARS
jgi:hypothetical protein